MTTNAVGSALRYDMTQVGFVASFASKLSDTVSSEIGKVNSIACDVAASMSGDSVFLIKLYAAGMQAYGRTTYLITSLQRVPRGTEGAVSLEGSLAGLAAALGFALLSFVIGQVEYTLSSSPCPSTPMTEQPA